MSKASTQFGVLGREYCNDGMSDRTFGFKMSLYNGNTIGGGAYQGCCTLEMGN